MSLLTSILAYFPSFVAGNRLIDGGDLQNLATELFSTKIAITAHAGGGQASGTALTATMNRVDTCATADDSVVLPQAIPGRRIWINNNTAAELAVFGAATNPVTGAGDTIAAAASNTQQATATGVTQPTTAIGCYTCFVAGQWKQALMVS